MPQTISTHRPDVRTRLQREPQIAKRVAEATSALEQYELQTLLFADALDPARVLENLNADISKATTPQEITTIQSQIAALEVSKQVAQRRAEAVCLESYAPVRAAVAALLGAANGVLAGYLKDAEASETRFFGDAGLPREQTSVSLCVIQAQGALQSFARGMDIAANRSGLPSITCPAVDYLRAHE